MFPPHAPESAANKSNVVIRFIGISNLPFGEDSRAVRQRAQKPFHHLIDVAHDLPSRISTCHGLSFS